MKKIAFVFMLVIFIFLSYWFLMRPAEIKVYCDSVAWNDTLRASKRQDEYNWKFKQCLNSQGL